MRATRPASDDEPILEVQFDDLEQQHETSMLGMWLFLATEVMFFGGLITAYAVYRSTSIREFAWPAGTWPSGSVASTP